MACWETGIHAIGTMSVPLVGLQESLLPCHWDAGHTLADLEEVGCHTTGRYVAVIPLHARRLLMLLLLLLPLNAAALAKTWS
jgi:hypothetical protein